MLLSCGGVEVKDSTIWSYLGDVEIAPGVHVAALGSHTNFLKQERMNIDQWIDFLTATDKHGPAICTSSRDYAIQKTNLEQACYKANCSYETQKVITDITARMGKHLARVKALTKRNIQLQSLDDDIENIITEFDPETITEVNPL
jgi:hypothetical protein